MRLLLSHSCSFWMSREAVLRARELGAAWASIEEMPVKGEEGCWLNERDREEHYSLDHLVPRNDEVLLQVFDELGGARMNGDEDYGDIYEVHVPDDLHYFVGSYLGEWIAEAHRTWSAESDGNPGGGPVFTKDSKYSDFSS